jgi:AraC-like DNA-binding protein
MPAQDEAFWQTYIAGTQFDLLHAAYTKVATNWRDDDYTPDYNKLYFIIEGEGYLKIRGRTYYPKPGEIYLLPAGTLQSYGTLNENTFGKYWCHFRAHIGNVPLFDLVDMPAFVKLDNVDEMTELFQRLIRYDRSAALTASLRTRAALLDITATMIELGQGAVRQQRSSTFDKMNEVLQYINDHLHLPVTVEELAQLAHFQPNYFIHVFKTFTHTTPIQYINRARIEKAARLLTLTEDPVSHIAEAVGMDTSYFSRMFKEHTGYAPTSYRDMSKQQADRAPRT